MLHVIESYENINSPDIDYVYGDWSNEVTIINIKNNNGYTYLSDNHVHVYHIRDMYSIDDLNNIIADLESCIDCTTDEYDINSDKISIELINDYINNETKGKELL